MRPESSGVSTDEVSAPAAVSAEAGRSHGGRRFPAEKVGEAILLSAVTLFFGYILYDSLSWPSAAARLPRIAIGLGAPFLLFRWYKVVWGGPEGPLSQIIDTGFRSSGNPKEDRKRFIRVVGMVLFLIAGIWLVGVEVAIPLGVVIYLWLCAGVGIVRSVAVGLVLLGVIVGLYDEVLNSPWPEPLLWTPFADI